jgi:hypothetical protein
VICIFIYRTWPHAGIAGHWNMLLGGAFVLNSFLFYILSDTFSLKVAEY